MGTLIALVVGSAVALLTRPILRRLPEPAAQDVPDGETKFAYADLAGSRFALGAGLLTFALAWVSTLLLDPALWPPWLVLATVGTFGALIDARTTWLPRRLTQIGWLLSAIAVVLSAVIAAEPWLLLRAAIGAVAAAGLYWAVWAVSRGGFGFGDVRFAPLIGAAAASVSPSALVWALFLGSVAGAVVGLIRLARGRRGAFPYAPSMLVGAYLALATLALV